MAKGANANQQLFDAMGPTLKRAANLRAGRTAKRRINRPEQDFQRQLVDALPSILPKGAFFFHVPNGGWRSPAESGILVGIGVKRGVPDLIIIWNGRVFCLELKADKGELTYAQKIAHAAIADAGAPVAVVKTMDEAIVALKSFGIPLRVKEWA